MKPTTILIVEDEAIVAADLAAKMMENPVEKVLRTDGIVGLATPTLLVRRDGGERPIADSGAPIRGKDGAIIGVVLIFRDISRRRKAEQALEQSEARLSLFVEHAPVALAMFDRDMRYLNASRRWISDYHLEDQEIIGRSHYDIFPEIGDGLRAVHRRCLAGAVEKAEADRFERADGSVQWLHWEARPWRGHDGEIGGIVIFTEDLTALKRSEQAAREALLRLNEAVRAGNIGLWEWEIATHRVVYSQEWKRQIGYAEHEIRDDFEEWRSRVHPDDLEGALATIRRSIDAARRDYQSTFRFRHRDGSYRWIMAQGSIVSNAAGKPVRMLGSHVDITEQKRGQEALEESTRRYRTLFERNMDGIYLHDLDGRILDVNPAAEAQSGHSRQELLSLTVFDLITGGGSREEILDQWNRWPIGQPILIEAHHRRRDGSVFPIEINTGKVAFHDEERILAMVRDISDRHRSEKERERLREELAQAQKMESVGRLAGGVAHDFNNMLGAIIGHAELAMELVAPGSPLHTDLREIMAAAQRSADLTRQLLAFARKQTVTPRVLDLNDAITDMIKMLRRLIGEDIDLAWMPGAELCPVKIDPAQTDQLLANLCVNARDAIDGVGKITIETRNMTVDADACLAHPDCKPGRYAMLKVSDDGCGMDEKTRRNLFEPFFTTKAVGQGTGLGLSTVYGIVKQNGGYIDVCSEPGQGATFKIYLPAVDDALEAPRQPAASVMVKGIETLLLVEDEPAILRLAASVLERLGYTVLSASSPEEALTLARKAEAPVDLLLTDVVMPGMNGQQLAARIREALPRVKVLYMSGYTADAVAHRGILEADVHFLQKPFSNQVLARKVREVLDTAPA